MANYNTDYVKAARRTWEAAEALPETCQSVAGYLYGVVTECAVKAIMRRKGLAELVDDRPIDPYYSHYPHLASRLRERIAGRGQAELAPFTENGFLSQWSTEMRYSDGRAISAKMVMGWRENAERALAHV